MCAQIKQVVDRYDVDGEAFTNRGEVGEEMNVIHATPTCRSRGSCTPLPKCCVEGIQGLLEGGKLRG